MYKINKFNELNIRLLKITINNIKNTENGVIDFPINDQESERKASVLGIYGANGSGKTAVISSLGILKNIMSGLPLRDDAYHYISKDKKEAFLKFDFSIKHFYFSGIISYQFNLIKDDENLRVFVSNERINYKLDTEKSLTTLIDVSRDSKSPLFTPKYKFEDLSKKHHDKIIDLVVSNKMSALKQESFVFRKETLEILNTTWQKEEEIRILMSLKEYARMNLFVVSNENKGHLSGDTLPLFFRLSDNETNSILSGSLGISYGKTELSQYYYDIYVKITAQLSHIINMIIPDMNLVTETYGETILKNGEKGIKFELMSVRNNIKIPIKYESDGIKKIISILSSLIAIVNKEGVLVAVDELDSGVFEYLLGELLEIINNSGQGQLIFTSHNLHPLELLNSDNIYFTTINPKNRYIKFNNVKTTNNLRNLYLREIVLRSTGQKEIVYDDIKSYKISKAFRKAGSLYGEISS
ncbi:MAG: AAA family ATPase [Acholeplasmataceae bacterium]